MSAIKKIFFISNLNKIRFKTVIYIAVFWTLIDYMIVLFRRDEPIHHNGIWFREAIMFFLSCIMGYFFVFRLGKMLRHYALWSNFLIKSFILLTAAFIIIFIIQFTNALIFQHLNASASYHQLISYALYKNWLLKKITYWISIFFATQMFLIINEKYSPGVFFDILSGKYIHPQKEKRIVMFMDLKDSTPIAEKLGHALNFEFIRDFIYQISTAVIEYDGTIYQYVGDEVVCSWKFAPHNMRKSLQTVIHARKYIQRKSNYFKNKYGIIPEFRVGMHVGEVTIGEIGVVKKELAMSGDTMNTTARIRSACNELKHHFIVSNTFVENINLSEWQAQSLGIIDLKGKGSGIELFSLKI